MSQHHASRREFVTGLGLGIAGLSIGGEARADGLFGLGRRRRNTSYVTGQEIWDFITPILNVPKFDNGQLVDDFGFLRPHPFYNGIPIPGLVEVLKPTAPDPATAPARLQIKNICIDGNQRWTGGNFGIYITRTPTLFHALHFKSDMPDMHPMAPVRPRGIEPRSEEHFQGNITEMDFMPRYALKGKASEAGPKLFDVTFSSDGRCPTIGKVASTIEFESLDSRDKVEESIGKGYFETIGTVDEPDEWTRNHLDKVGPLNAVWLFILAHNEYMDKRGISQHVETPSLAIARLGRGHRFWHVLDHDRNPDGYKMDAFRRRGKKGRDKFREIKFEIELCGAMNKGRKECPDEKVVLSCEIEWS